MKVAIGADHAGFELKEKIKDFLTQENYEVVDVGAHQYEKGDDYPLYAHSTAEMVSRGEADRGILVCDSGIGVDIVANKVPGVRSALINDEQLAIITRQHNDTNVLSLGAMLVDADKAKKITKNWLETEFSGDERHKRRIREIEDIERQEILLHEHEVQDDGE